jgi:hypothetical protein
LLILWDGHNGNPVRDKRKDKREREKERDIIGISKRRRKDEPFEPLSIFVDKLIVRDANFLHHMSVR